MSCVACAIRRADYIDACKRVDERDKRIAELEAKLATETHRAEENFQCFKAASARSDELTVKLAEVTNERNELAAKHQAALAMAKEDDERIGQLQAERDAALAIFDGYEQPCASVETAQKIFQYMRAREIATELREEKLRAALAELASPRIYFSDEIRDIAKAALSPEAAPQEPTPEQAFAQADATFRALREGKTDRAIVREEGKGHLTVEYVPNTAPPPKEPKKPEAAPCEWCETGLPAHENWPERCHYDASTNACVGVCTASPSPEDDR